MVKSQNYCIIQSERMVRYNIRQIKKKEQRDLQKEDKMRNYVRKITAFVTAIAMTMASGVTVNATSWKQDGKGWWFENTDGTYVSNAWKQINGKWYAFDNQGYMRTGW